MKIISLHLFNNFSKTVKFVLFNDASRAHSFLSYHRLLDVKHMDTLFTIGSKWSFICASHRQDSTNHGLCWTSYGSLVGASGLYLPIEPCGALTQGLESVSGLKIPCLEIPCLDWDANPVPTSLMADRRLSPLRHRGWFFLSLKVVQIKHVQLNHLKII